MRGHAIFFARIIFVVLTVENFNVNTVVVQPDGKILVGGTFASFNGVFFKNLARLQADGKADATFTIGSGSLIKGFEQAVIGMKVGGQRRAIIPPELAYGSSSPSATIPANATLVVEITLTSLQ